MIFMYLSAKLTQHGSVCVTLANAVLLLSHKYHNYAGLMLSTGI